MKLAAILIKKIVLAVLLIGISSFAQTKKDSLNILFVGNSYTYFENMPQIVSLISNKTTTYLVTKKSIIGGARLREHWHSERGLKTKDLIESNIVVDWQAIIYGTILSGISAYFCIHFFLKLLEKIGMMPFIIYRLVLGVILLLLFV